MNCLYCHNTANKSTDPGLPAVVDLHGLPQHDRAGSSRDRPRRKSVTARRSQSSASTPTSDGDGAGIGPNAKPIPWIRIHKVPEYVHFPHMRHVNAGVTCQTCHGQIQNMDRVYQFATLNMGWCVSCHVNGYSPKEGLEAAGYAPRHRAAGDAAATTRRRDGRAQEGALRLRQLPLLT